MRRLLTYILCAVSIVAPMAGTAFALTGNQPLVIVLCKFTDQTDEPTDVKYFQDLFSETGAGESNVFDFWKDVSYGNVDLTGTVVKGWYTAKTTVAQFNALPRSQQIDVCAKEADNDVDFTKFAGVGVVVNHKNLTGPLFGGGRPTTINGTTYNSLGVFVTEWDQAYNGILHESLHALAMNHSRAITNTATKYGLQRPVRHRQLLRVPRHTGQGVSRPGRDLPPGGQPQRGGPGLNAVQLLNTGWLAANRVLALSSPCVRPADGPARCLEPSRGDRLSGDTHSRGRADLRRGGVRHRQRPATITRVELRDKSGWDEGIGRTACSSISTARTATPTGVDADGAWGAYSGAIACQRGKCALLLPGGRYVDAAMQNLYVAVNSIDEGAHTAVVTIGSRDPNAQDDCSLGASIAYSGATTGDFSDVVTLAADIVAAGSTAPVPDATVSFTIGTQGCTAVTDAAGHAQCSVQLKQHPGGYNVTAGFAGDEAYDAATASAAFTITQEESQVTYGGQLTSDYHDAFTASAKPRRSGRRCSDRRQADRLHARRWRHVFRPDRQLGDRLVLDHSDPGRRYVFDQGGVRGRR